MPTAQPPPQTTIGPPPPHRLFRGFLDEATLAALLEHALANQARFQASAVYDGAHDPARRASLSLRDLGPVADDLRDRITAILPDLFTELGTPAFPRPRLEFELAAYGDGARFGRHLDTRLGDGASHGSVRMISTVFYFFAQPKAFSGGALRLYRFGATEGGDGYTDVEVENNLLLAFPSWAPHEVTPVACPSGRFEDSRFALNCWIHRRG